ncbi:MAG: bacterioferritin [Proteobacteria bacterium]|nr:MAG: bacterioferritin [Pseudomonadota bacterium]
MYVCVCNAISDRQIREVVDRGATSVYDVQCHLPVASCCGRCEDVVREVIETHRVNAQRPASAAA